MPYKFSRCISIQTDDLKRAAEFYKGVLGFEVKDEPDDHCIELDGEQNRLFLEDDKLGGVVMELIVPDLETARIELLKAGCSLISWNGKGKDNYVRDPFGFVFNIWEGPEAF